MREALFFAGFDIFTGCSDRYGVPGIENGDAGIFSVSGPVGYMYEDPPFYMNSFRENDSLRAHTIAEPALRIARYPFSSDRCNQVMIPGIESFSSNEWDHTVIVSQNNKKNMMNPFFICHRVILSDDTCPDKTGKEEEPWR